MKIARTSYFKKKEDDLAWYYDWAMRLQALSGHTYQKLEIKTELGNTLIWQTGNNKAQKTIVIFPGFRTSALFWDLDKGLDALMNDFKIYLVETNGQPNPSDGNSPSIKSLDYGHWAKQVLNELKIKKTYIAGASFGGLVCMKLAIVAPEKIQAAFLLNPGCTRFASFGLKNMYYVLLPILKKSEKNVRLFLDNVVFAKPNHELKTEAENLCVEYELKAIQDYKDNTEKPYNMDRQLNSVQTTTYMLVGDKDILMPYKKSVTNAQKNIPGFKEFFLFKDVGHGIETYRPALEKVKELVLKSEN